MKTLGIVAEYNPFHNGHLYHLEQVKLASGADQAVCVMSGNFVQRGEPAIVNKWARAKMALLCGADLVVELPVPYAMATAEFFASGAVRILGSLGIVDVLGFGSESGNVEILDAIADVLVEEPAGYSEPLRGALSRGESFPSARQEALEAYFKESPSPMAGFSASDIAAMLNQSNNILGIEYLKALKKQKSSIVPLTIPRVGNTYNSKELTGAISSATAIRENILGKKASPSADVQAPPGSDMQVSQETDIQAFSGSADPGFLIPDDVLPLQSRNILREEFALGRGPVSPAHFENIILSILRKMKTGEIAALPYVSEGLENRIKEAAATSGTLEEMTDRICTRRYPRTRVRRILFSALIGLTAQTLELFNVNGGPQYIRVLGFNEKGKAMLAKANKTASLPIIVKAANFRNDPNPLVSKMLDLEASATDMYVLAYANPAFRTGGQEYTCNVARVDLL